MIRFYSPYLPESLTLPESDSGHAVRVLRMRNGDTLEIVDGRGSLYRCTIVNAHPKHTEVAVNDILSIPKNWLGTISIAIAPTKHSDRMEWLVEKLVEIGIDRIVPLRCHRSERKEINRDRLEKIAVSAMKQSLKAVLPQIDATTSYADFIANCNDSQRFIAYCDQSIERRLLTGEYRPGENTTILIGPEGDFDSEEIRAALDLGWSPVSLGDERLRTETAALYAVTACHVLNDRLIKHN